ncbi:MAG: diaminobutyrate acetyltransferase [Ectothiorhodospiraceae bacterium]|nr:diaminobutyrate acetyltransferase [Chromatiales bacterium]MCP5154042.1 diaminobutyrate acetyltransferase [Ectothiorhodospiraceae bacterium]
MPVQSAVAPPLTRPDRGREIARSTISIAPPRGTDAADVHALVADCPPLDRNSLYANLLQCTHFATTCALARRRDDVVGWVSGYLPPDKTSTYFLWQVAVRDDARGQRLPLRLVRDILARPVCREVRYLETTITPDNSASWALFESIAAWLSAPLRRKVHFEREAHFRGRHEPEVLVTIGPFSPPRLN